MNKWVKYKNGNYTVVLNTLDGTKIRYNNEDNLIPDTVESMDIKLTNKCSGGTNCSFCHENSTPDGKHGDILSPGFLDNLHPYTELALGGGNVLEHPDLDKFLLKCKEKKFIPSMTVNQIHFEKDFDRIKKLIDDKLVYGLGVSLVNPTHEFIEKVKQFPTAVIHVIAGLITEEQLKILKGNDLKLLILGYKRFRRGEKLYSSKPTLIDMRINMLDILLPHMLEDKWFKVISFDNLALRQLQVEALMSKEEWEEFYMGDDGLDGEGTSASIYVDMVERKFGKNSCAPLDERYPLMDTIEEMYNYLYKK